MSLSRSDGTPLSESPIAEALRLGAMVRDRELLLTRPNGAQLTVAVDASAIAGTDGRVAAVVATFRRVARPAPSASDLDDLIAGARCLKVGRASPH